MYKPTNQLYKSTLSYSIMTTQGISQVIRYQQQLKAKIQQTETVILDGRLNKQQLDMLKGFIEEEDILIKYLEIESSKLQPDVRQLYSRNMTRFKKKIKEHKEYVNSQFGQGAIASYHDTYQVAQTLKMQQQNAKFMDQKRAMYENQHLQNNLGRDLERQGFYLQNNINRNRQIRQQADAASDSIKLIKRSIFKRKFMFYSLFILAGIAIVFVTIKKIFLIKM